MFIIKAVTQEFFHFFIRLLFLFLLFIALYIFMLQLLGWFHDPNTTSSLLLINMISSVTEYNLKVIPKINRKGPNNTIISLIFEKSLSLTSKLTHIFLLIRLIKLVVNYKVFECYTSFIQPISLG